MNEKEELTQIVKKVQEDIAQFELLYSHIINKVYFWCYTIAKDETVAKDMAQEAMIRIYNKFDTLITPETFSSWMYQLVRNSCLNYLRDNKRYEADFLSSEDFNDGFEDSIEDERSDNLPDEAYSLNETRELIRGFINKLPRKQREVITLYYLEEFKTTEIADILESKVNSIRALLHAGRKNLELQINDYQEKNNIKLYSTLVLPFIGIVLSEYREELCDAQNLQYEKNLYSSNNGSLLAKLSQMLTSKIGIIITSIACIGAIAMITASVLQNEAINNKTKLEANTSVTIDTKMYSKSKGHPYIKDITYLKFPMREGVEVKIELKKDLLDKDIKILYNDEELAFQKSGKEIRLQTLNNGIYTIQTSEHETLFEIYNIDPQAPELVEAFIENEYLSLVISDEMSQINYKKSFVENQGTRYKIPENLQIKGAFSGIVKVTLFHNNGYKIIYDLDFNTK